MTAGRERAVSAAFVSLTNNLVDGVDVVDLLSDLTTHCAALLDVASAGLLLADPRGVLHVVAASSERTRNLELFQLQREQGPCLDCYHTGEAVTVVDLSREAARWPEFVSAAESVGFRSVHALPMRLRDTVLGALGLFGTKVGALPQDDLDLGQALAHVASVALATHQSASNQSQVNEQLQLALTSRVLVEQAKGILAQTGGFEMDEAFAVLRGYARDHNLKLADLAAAVVHRKLPPGLLLEHAAVKTT